MLQEFWSIMDEIDKVLWVVDATKPTYAMSQRLLALGIFLVTLEVTVACYYLSLIKLPYVA
jgi:E3 ubiquitin-protein ligase FANCL